MATQKSPSSSSSSSVRGKAVSARGKAPLFTVPGLSVETALPIINVLQQRLHSLIDLGLTLKHIHWNVVGPQFIAVHQMLDPQVTGVLGMVDAAAERISTLGGSPNGLPGNLVDSRSWDDYALSRGLVSEHLGALDLVYVGVIEDHRNALEAVVGLDAVTEDLIIGQLRKLELYHWFVRAHLESASGHLATSGASTEAEAASQASIAAVNTE